MDDHAQIVEDKTGELSSDTLSATMLFERLPPEIQIALLEFMRQLSDNT